MNCYLCEASPDPNVPLLTCGHYLCPPCYCHMRNDKNDFCLLCKKLLKRGRRNNTTEII